MLDKELVAVLACPEDRGPLLYFPDEPCLYNPRLKRRYKIEEEIPILLIDEAVPADLRSPRRDLQLLPAAEPRRGSLPWPL